MVRSSGERVVEVEVEVPGPLPVVAVVVETAVAGALVDGGPVVAVPPSDRVVEPTGAEVHAVRATRTKTDLPGIS